MAGGSRIPQSPWWVVVRWTCEKCGHTFMDEHNYSEWATMATWARCPECKHNTWQSTGNGEVLRKVNREFRSDVLHPAAIRTLEEQK